MRSSFKDSSKDIKIQVTEIGTSEKRELRAAQIESFKPTEGGQTIINYYLREGGDKLEKITVTDGCKDIAKALNGEPSAYEESEMLVDVEQEVRQGAESDLVKLERKYTEDKEELDLSHKDKIASKEKEIKTKVKDVDDLKNSINSSVRGRFAKKLHDKIVASRSQHFGYNSPRSKRRSVVFKIIAIGGLSRNIFKVDALNMGVRAIKGDLDRMSASQECEKNNKQSSFEEERDRLVELRDNPDTSHEIQGFLKAKIRDYRSEHGDKDNFNFARKIGGNYENKQTPEPKLLRGQQQIEDNCTGPVLP